MEKKKKCHRCSTTVNEHFEFFKCRSKFSSVCVMTLMWVCNYSIYCIFLYWPSSLYTSCIYSFFVISAVSEWFIFFYQKVIAFQLEVMYKTSVRIFCHEFRIFGQIIRKSAILYTWKSLLFYMKFIIPKATWFISVGRFWDLSVWLKS